MAYVDFALEHRSHFKVMWEGGISKEKYPRLPGQRMKHIYCWKGRLRTCCLPLRLAGKRLVASAWSLVHGFATLTLERELEVAAADKEAKKLLRQSLHLLLDQFGH